MPDKKIVPVFDVYLSSRVTGANSCTNAVVALTSEDVAEFVSDAEADESEDASTRPADFIAVSDDIVELQKICDFCVQRTWAASGKTQVCSELMGR